MNCAEESLHSRHTKPCHLPFSQTQKLTHSVVCVVTQIFSHNSHFESDSKPDYIFESKLRFWVWLISRWTGFLRSRSRCCSTFWTSFLLLQSMCCSKADERALYQKPIGCLTFWTSYTTRTGAWRVLAHLWRALAHPSSHQLVNFFLGICCVLVYKLSADCRK